MTEYNKVFLDTTPLIYFLDNDVNFGNKTKAILEEILSNDKTIVSSVITCEEYLVYPYRTDNQEKVDVFFEFTDACGIDLTPISTEIAYQHQIRMLPITKQGQLPKMSQFCVFFGG